jgi:hypothetical protein
MKSFYLLVVCLLFAVSAGAQCNCMSVTPALVGDSKSYGPFWISSETQTWKITCKAAGQVQDTENNVTTAKGSGGLKKTGILSTTDVVCNPRFEQTWEYGIAVSNAYFTNDGWNGLIEDNDTVGAYCYYAATPDESSTTYCGYYQCRSCAGGSPIVIDIGGDGFHLTDAKDGVNFDIFGSGKAVRMGWTAPGAMNAFLALPGADGLVHNIAQLFGADTPQPQSSCPNGYAALAVYDTPAKGGNGDGIIDKRDAIWPSLRLWIDRNHDGVSTPDELYPLDALGVNSISLHYTEDRKTDQWGNAFRYRDRVNPDDPDASKVGRTAYDIYFVVAE